MSMVHEASDPQDGSNALGKLRMPAAKQLDEEFHSGRSVQTWQCLLSESVSSIDSLPEVPASVSSVFQKSLMLSDDEMDGSPQLAAHRNGDEGPFTQQLADDSSSRVKLMCSYGGKILPRPSDGKLRYVGGETRIVSVNRDITYRELMLKMRQHFSEDLHLKYQLPNEDIDSLISVCTDEDLQNMMEEYDRLEASEGLQRLRVFLFSTLEGDMGMDSGLSDPKVSEQWYVEAVNGKLDSAGSSFKRSDGGTSGGRISARPSNENLISLDAPDMLEELGVPPMSKNFHQDHRVFPGAAGGSPSLLPQQQLRQHSYANLLNVDQFSLLNPDLELEHHYPPPRPTPESMLPRVGSHGKLSRLDHVDDVYHGEQVFPRVPAHHDEFMHGYAAPEPMVPRVPSHGKLSRFQDPHEEQFMPRVLSHGKLSRLHQEDDIGYTAEPILLPRVPSHETMLPRVPSHGKLSRMDQHDEFEHQLMRGYNAETMVPSPSHGKLSRMDQHEDQLMRGYNAEAMLPRVPSHGKLSRLQHEQPEELPRGGMLPKVPSHGKLSRLHQNQHEDLQQEFLLEQQQRQQQRFLLQQSQPYSLMHQQPQHPQHPHSVEDYSLRQQHQQQHGLDDFGMRTHPAEDYSYNLRHPGPLPLHHPTVFSRPVEDVRHQEDYFSAGRVFHGNGSAAPYQVKSSPSSPHQVPNTFGYHQPYQLQRGYGGGGGGDIYYGRRPAIREDHGLVYRPSLSPPRYRDEGYFQQHQQQILQEHPVIYPSFRQDSSHGRRHIHTSPLNNSTRADYQLQMEHLSLNESTLPSVEHKNELPIHPQSSHFIAGQTASAGSKRVSKGLSFRELETSEQSDARGNDKPIYDDEKLRSGPVYGDAFPTIKSEVVDVEPPQQLSSIQQMSETGHLAEDMASSVLKSGVLDTPQDDHDNYDLLDKVEEEPPGNIALAAEQEAIARGLQTIRNADLEEIRELGSGTYGTVYHGKWRGTDVAIKRIKASCFAGKPSERQRLIADFWREACTLSQLHHPNVVAFYGVVPDGPDGTLATVTEFMVNGSLKQVLHKKDRTIDRRKRLLIATDAAFGMEYLHEKNIVHFDLKCENLLVNMRDSHRPICKVGDLGLSKVKRQTMVSGGVRGTLPWMAPELLSASNGMVTEKVDAFSFGIVMWELLTGEEPYANMHYGTIIAGIVSNSLRPAIPNWCDPGWRSLMEKCWAAEPKLRPSFCEIANELRAMAASLQPKA